MPDQTKLLVDALRLRIAEPGAFLPRDHSGPESFPNWGARAIHAGLEDGALGYVPAEQRDRLAAERDDLRDRLKATSDALNDVRNQLDAELHQVRFQLESARTDAVAYRELADQISALASDAWDDDAAEVDILIRFVKHLATFHPDCPGPICDRAEEAAEAHAQAHAQGYAEAVTRLRDDERYRNWWTARPGAPGSYPVYWDGPGRTHLADYLETVGPDGIDVETGIGVRSAGRALLEVLQYVALPFEANRAAYRLRCAFGMSDAPQPVNETESSGAAARRLAGELERLLEGLAERGITPGPDAPVPTAAVDTALAAVDGLESTVRMMEGAVRLARGPAAECGAGCGEGHRYDKTCGLGPVILGPTRRLRERPTVVERLRSADLLLESAWGVIANVGNPLGDWDSMPQEWREAAVEWARGYHAWLDERRVAGESQASEPAPPKLAQGGRRNGCGPACSEGHTYEAGCAIEPPALDDRAPRPGGHHG